MFHAIVRLALVRLFILMAGLGCVSTASAQARANNPNRQPIPLRDPPAIEQESLLPERESGGTLAPDNIRPDVPRTESPRRDQRAPQFNFESNVGLPRRATMGAVAAGFSAVPSMIGDTSGGSCGTIQFGSGRPAASVAHPTFACSRLNISENNSALVRDRVYVSFRRFHATSNVSAFETSLAGGRSDSLDIHRWTFGWETVVLPGMSVEMRLPVDRRLSSRMVFSQITPLPVGDVTTIVPDDDDEIELGNVSVIAKGEWYRSSRLVVSGGLAFNLPTSPDVRARVDIQNATFEFVDPLGNAFFVSGIQNQYDAIVGNELFSMSPFVAFACAPSEKWFVQGFAQIDQPVTELEFSIAGSAAITSFGVGPISIDAERSIEIQSLGRLNLGIGRWTDVRLPKQARLALTAEMHYTTTLEDAKTVAVPVAPEVPGVLPATEFELGNLSNRSDILNGVIGSMVYVGQTTFTGGLSLPIRTGDDRGFEYELSLVVDRRF